MKKIAFGCTLLNRGLAGEGIDGIGHYCQELLAEYGKDPGNLEILPYSFGYPNQFSGETKAFLTSQTTSEYAKYPLYLALAYAGISTRNSANNHLDAFKNADLIHAPDHLIPMLRSSTNRLHKIPLIASIMDVIPISHPQFIRSKFARAKALIWKSLSRNANHIITISEFSKQEIARHMQYPLEQISAIPLGIDKQYFEPIGSEKIAATLKKFAIKGKFFLSIGTVQPRKNLARILQAHTNLPHNLAKEFPLVLVGRFAWDDGDIIQAIKRGVAADECIWINYVSDEEKRCLLQAAFALAFISLYEGFGLPMLEAFASGAPVICSNTTAMPELAGDAALQVDPLALDEITVAMQSLINDPHLHERLRLAGIKKAQAFTWQKTWHSSRAISEHFF